MPALDDVVDTTRYPLHDPAALAGVVAAVRRDLATDGCCVLPDLVRPAHQERLRAEGAALAPDAYYDVETVNVYNTGPDDTLPADHPARIPLQRGNAFVARDRIPADALIQQIYTDPSFRGFVAACFGLARVHELADPLSGLVLNVITPGREHPWHFDTNTYTVSLLTQEAEDGGEFQFCPGIRAPGRENLDAVRAVLDGHPMEPWTPRRLALRPGDLQLFQGRYALHRVSPVRGATARHTAILAYSERPGVIGTVDRTRQLFGRVTDAHLTRDAAAHPDRLLI